MVGRMRRWMMGMAAGLVLAGCGGAVRETHSGAADGTPAAAAAQPVAVGGSAAARFGRAHRMVEAGQCAAAVPALEALRAAPALEDYALFDLARCAAGTDPRHSAARLARLIDAHPRSVLAPPAELLRGRLLLRDDPATARALLDRARRDGDAETAMQASLALADLALARGEPAVAAAHLQAARERAPGTPAARDAKARLLALRAADARLDPHGDALAAELTLLMAEQDYDAAIRVADERLTSAPRAQRPGIVRQRAEAERGAGDLEAALATLRALIRDYPAAPQAAEAQYRLAALLWNRDRNAEARIEFERFLARHPRHARTPEVRYALARIAAGEGDDAAAIAAYRRLIEAFPDAPQAREARWRIGWIRYQAGAWPEAAAAFAAAAQGRGVSGAPDAVYWQARALERAGDRAAAKELYRTLLERAPASYYGDWAARRLGEARDSGAAPAVPPRPGAVGAAPPDTDPDQWVRARGLVAADLRPQARRELQRFERDHRGNRAAAAALPAAYQAADGYRDAIRLVSARGGGDTDVLYPIAFWPQVSRAAAAEQVDPLLLLALMRQESLFDPAARSPADARGLMQLLPSTAERVALARGEPAPTDLTDPDVNVALGTAYLASLLRDYHGDPLRALAAYNGGDAAVAKWQERYGGREADEWVESITYRETRDYVKKVVGNHRRYQQLYAR